MRCARPDRQPEPGVDVPGRALRVASIDIGGGTTDTWRSFTIRLDDGVGPKCKITPHLLFREGFEVAGDGRCGYHSALRTPFPAETALQRAGVAGCRRPAGDLIWRFGTN